MSPPAALALTLAILLVSSCHDQVVDAPDRVVGSPIDNLLGCSELQAAELTVDDGVLATAAETAGCASDGLRCPLDDHPDVAERCEPPKRALAQCDLERWVLTCAAVATDAGHAGAAGAGGAAGSSGQSGASAMPSDGGAAG